jgi:hypothetical protein
MIHFQNRWKIVLKSGVGVRNLALFNFLQTFSSWDMMNARTSEAGATRVPIVRTIGAACQFSV